MLARSALASLLAVATLTAALPAHAEPPGNSHWFWSYDGGEASGAKKLTLVAITALGVAGVVGAVGFQLDARAQRNDRDALFASYGGSYAAMCRSAGTCEQYIRYGERADNSAMWSIGSLLVAPIAAMGFLFVRGGWPSLTPASAWVRPSVSPTAGGVQIGGAF